MAYVNLLDVVYPVGSIYMSMTATSPAEFIGGTWEALDGRFMYLVSDASVVGTTGGEKTHVLAIGEMPKHNHITSIRINWFDTLGAGVPTTYSNSGNNLRVDYRFDRGSVEGNDQAHNNMPPYLAVYGWRRTA